MPPRKPVLREDLFDSILSQPTAPFREGHVVRAITSALTKARVPHFLDPVGNIVVGAKNKAEYQKLVRQKTSDPLRFFVAHMDHPGFHGTEWLSPTRLRIEWHGGSPTEHLEGAPVWLADPSGWLPSGKLTSATLIPSGRGIQKGAVELDAPVEKAPAQIFGGFKFRAPLWKEGRVVYTKAADDGVGAFAIVSLAMDLARKRAPFLGLLTRAEEVGFIGAIGHFELGWLEAAKRPILCVSLETSRTLPDAEIGKGPIVRLGDRRNVFDPAYVRLLGDLAEKTLPGKYQRRIMDGGTCEASAALAYGLLAIGISVPLGNYHNQSLEGGPDAAGPNGPAPEFVHLDDVEGLLQLCQNLIQQKLPWSDPWKAGRLAFRKELRRYQPHLRADS